MEAPPMVCYSMGAINSLVEKITPLVENHPKIDNLLRDIMSFREDLLNKFAGRRGTGEQFKVWMKQVREMIDDIEDWIDLEHKAASSSNFDEWQIDQFVNLIEEARERCERYELLKLTPSSDAQVPYAGAGPREVAGGRLLLEEKTVLVGLDGPKSELLKHLKKDEEDQLKVVSVHGTGGHGKTALAMLIYGDSFIKEFECQAFVTVGRTTSTRTTLIEILSQVMKSEVNAWQSRSYSEIISILWGFLHTKRYFICIDDIRNTEDSRAILCALPDNNFGSRIVTTTRMKDIAISCSCRPNDVVYEMVALNKADSKSLFCNSLHVQKEEWPDQFEESSNKMLKLCGGVPMAIIIIAGLLGRTSAELSAKSEQLNKTILFELNQSYSALQVMKMILDISYEDLPLPLKSCFLYLAVFSANCDINKDRLIRRWVAEGLIPGNSSLETGESYFNELISRRLIQPSFDNNDDQPIGCTVNGVVFDFMEHLSTEENFITAGAELKSGLFPCDRVRRVSLDCGDEDDEGKTYYLLEDKSWVAASTNGNTISDKDETISLHLPRVRSLAFSGDASRIPDLLAFKHLWVLDLEDTKGLENKQLESIGLLSLLRYLGLGRTDVTQLPPEIMALELLTTLDLRRASVRRLPELRDKKLVSLLGDQLILARGMGGMQKLEELSKVLVGPDGSSVDNMRRLVRESVRLRMLGLRFSHLHGYNNSDRQGVRRFLEEVGKSNLQSLLLDNYPHPLLDLLVGSWAHKLRRFELRIRGCLPQVLPQEISSLVALTHLHINVEVVEAHIVRALGNLPKLVLLELRSNTSPCLTVSSMDGFQCLKVFWYNCRYGGGMGLRFDVGAMPLLRRLRLYLDARETRPDDDFNFGIQHLPCLLKVHATIDGMNTTLTASEAEAAEVHIREQVCRNPNNPVLELAIGNPRLEGSVIAIDSLDKWKRHIETKKLVVINFTVAWCPACRKMAPVFADLANMFRDVVFLKIDLGVADMNNIASQFKVNGLPTLLFMKEGYVKDRIVGKRTDEEQELKEKLYELLALLY